MSRLILKNNMLVEDIQPNTMNITINKQENILNNLVLQELVDMKRLNTLLNIKNEPLLHWESEFEEQQIDYRILLKSYKKKCKNNIVKTKY